MAKSTSKKIKASAKKAPATSKRKRNGLAAAMARDMARLSGQSGRGVTRPNGRKSTSPGGKGES